MSKVDIAGIGIWAPAFADWASFCDGLASGRWSTNPDLQPGLIPARERRRAPQPVKMAIEVMHQACTMASRSPGDVSVVFSSAMGDMLITDYLCRTLAESPRLVSPTRFHNSVHNAAPGYWSITTGAFTPATAVSAYDFTATMALLEGAIQVVEEDAPVVVVTQELAAPVPLLDTCPSRQPFSAALLLTPSGQSAEPVCSMKFSVSADACPWPALDPLLCNDFASNFGARLLPLLAALARGPERSEHRFPISEFASLSLLLVPASDSVD